MPPADKRQRKKENARMAREAREAELKRKRRNRTIRNAAIAVAIFVILLVAINVFSSNKKKSVAVSPTSVPASTTTTVAYPAGCVGTVPKASTKPTNLTAPPMTVDPAKTYTATISTTCGSVTIALDAKNAPKSVNNFVSLAKSGFYDGLRWHRVALNPPVVQGGDPLGTGNGGPGYSIPVELPADGQYPVGAVAWAKSGTAPDGSAGSQFFIDTADASSIGNHYGYIGKVTAGFANVQKLGSFAVSGSSTGAPSKPLYILKVTITEK